MKNNKIQAPRVACKYTENWNAKMKKGRQGQRELSELPSQIQIKYIIAMYELSVDGSKENKEVC